MSLQLLYPVLFTIRILLYLLTDRFRLVAVAEVEKPHSPAPNVIVHAAAEYKRTPEAEVDRPRSPAPNVIVHAAEYKRAATPNAIGQ